MGNNPKRKIAALAEGKFGPLDSKTANQAIRYIPGEVVAVIDSRKAGTTAQQVLGFGGDIPVVANLHHALRFRPDTLLIGIAPAGGRLPELWRGIVCEAIGAGLNIISGLHTFLSDDPELAAHASRSSVCIDDLRKVPPEYEVVTKGSWRNRKAKTILTVGTDCNVGKMTASLEMHREFVRRGLASDFVATGQTGMLLSGRGVSVDSIVSDYIGGATEHEIDLRETEGARFIHVEGQGSILHQGYSPVTLGLIHGTMPDAMVLVHHPARGVDHYGFSVNNLPMFIKIHESLVTPFKPTKVVGVAVNTVLMTRQHAETSIREIEEQTGLPAADVLTPMVAKLADAILEYVQYTPKHG